MGDIKPSHIAQSLAGRDKGRLFFIIGTEDGYAYLADGKLRKLRKAKRKKLRHLRVAGQSDTITAYRIGSGEKVTDAEIRRALAVFRGALKF